jgi:hypothetical protein
VERGPRERRYRKQMRKRGREREQSQEQKRGRKREVRIDEVGVREQSRVGRRMREGGEKIIVL